MSERVEENNVDRGEQKEVRIDLYELKCWPEVQGMLKAGEKPGTVARWLQDQGNFPGVLRDSVRKAVARAKLVGGPTDAERKLAELRAKANESYEANEGIKETVYIDVLKEAGELFTLQMDRVRMGRKLENDLKFMVKSLTADVAEAREVLKFVFEIQGELGLTKRPNLPQSDGPKRLFEGMGFDGRKRVLEAIDMVRARVKRLELEDQRVRDAAEETVIDIVGKEVGGKVGVVGSEGGPEDAADAPASEPEGLPFE